MKKFADRCTATDPVIKIVLQIQNLEPTMEPVADPKNGVLMEFVSITQMLHMFKVSCVLKDAEPATIIMLGNENIHNCPF